MKIIIASDEGEVLDTINITREEFDNLTPIGAYAILAESQIGDAR